MQIPKIPLGGFLKNVEICIQAIWKIMAKTRVLIHKFTNITTNSTTPRALTTKFDRETVAFFSDYCQRGCYLGIIVRF